MTTTYVDYTYYHDTYLGSVIASSVFAKFALRASAKIDRLTFGRAAPIVTADTDAETIDKIKMATCAIAEEIYSIEQSGGNDGISSESIGNNSVSYVVGAKQTQTINDRCAVVADEYLSGTGLLFASFSDGEYSGDAN